MTNPLTIASTQTLTAYLAVLDFQISKFSNLFSSLFFKTSSLMLSGKNCIGKEFNELIIWDAKNPLPKNRVREFLQSMAQDLIWKRLQVIKVIDVISNMPALVETMTVEMDKTTVASCKGCGRHTLHRNYLTIPGSSDIIIPVEAGFWICNECETIVKL